MWSTGPGPCVPLSYNKTVGEKQNKISGSQKACLWLANLPAFSQMALGFIVMLAIIGLLSGIYAKLGVEEGGQAGTLIICAAAAAILLILWRYILQVAKRAEETADQA